MSYNELEIDENLSMHRKMWVVQRVGWAVIAVIVACALSGLFGLGGPQARVRRENGWGVLAYERFLRWNGPILMEIRLERHRPLDDEIKIWISTDFVREIKLDTITPTPESVSFGDGRIELRFSVARSPGLRQFPIIVRGEAAEIGWHSGRIGLIGEDETFEIGQFVYP